MVLKTINGNAENVNANKKNKFVQRNSKDLYQDNVHIFFDQKSVDT